MEDPNQAADRDQQGASSYVEDMDVATQLGLGHLRDLDPALDRRLALHEAGSTAFGAELEASGDFEKAMERYAAAGAGLETGTPTDVLNVIVPAPDPLMEKAAEDTPTHKPGRPTLKDPNGKIAQMTKDTPSWKTLLKDELAEKLQEADPDSAPRKQNWEQWALTHSGSELRRIVKGRI